MGIKKCQNTVRDIVFCPFSMSIQFMAHNMNIVKWLLITYKMGVIITFIQDSVFRSLYIVISFLFRQCYYYLFLVYILLVSYKFKGIVQMFLSINALFIDVES